MSGVSKKLMGTTAAGGGFTAIEDVFSTYLYKGNGSTQTITNGIDLAGEGGLVWIKSRGDNNAGPENHQLFDTERGANKVLQSNSTLAEATYTERLTSFNSDGFSVGSAYDVNNPFPTFASWTFRKAPRFFDVGTITFDGSGVGSYSHNLGMMPGVVILKLTNTTGDWFVWHKDLTSQNYAMFLNDPAAQSNQGGWATYTDTTVSFNSSVFANDTAVVYLFAHDPLGPSEDGSDGLISCGSYTGDGTGEGPETILGWEPQWLMVKRADAAGPWLMIDTMRGWTNSTASDPFLTANTSGAEGVNPYFTISSTGFRPLSSTFAFPGSPYIYIAIRRGPMRVPESGTEVFAPAQFNGTKFPTGFPVDFAIAGNASGSDKWYFQSRLQGAKVMSSASTAGELGSGSAKFDIMDGYGTGFSTAYYSTAFRRAPNFFDVVAYTGTGNPLTLNHNLGVAPELVLYKSRSASEYWLAQSSAMTSVTDSLMLLNQNNGEITSSGFFRTPDESTFGFAASGNLTGCNTAGVTYIAYLFATLAGVSKVGSYTGNGTTLNIDCGFTTGARFVLIKGSSFTHDWHVFDTARGIVAGNDPFLELNTTNAENASYDAVDPLSSGFTVNQTAVANLNADGASYIFYAIA